MNRYLLSSAALHDFSDNNFARRASLAHGLHMGTKKKPKVEISLEDQPEGFHVPSYTTLDRIRGKVTITAPCDLPFDDLHISLQGTTRTWVEKIATAAPTNTRSRAFHTFLRLTQPIAEDQVPEPRIFRAGKVYQVPFEFVIPERLLPQACSHVRKNAQVEDEHLKLPASLGDAMVSGDGKSLLPDYSPEMANITYAIRVVVSRKAPEGQKRPTMLADEQQKLRIVPRVDELPPLEIIDEPGEDYVLKRCKNIKKGLLMGKTRTGKLTVEAQQPGPLRLPNVRYAASSSNSGGGGGEDPASVMTMVTLRLRFEPTKANMKPPKLHMLWSRLKIATFFSTVPQKAIPNKSAAFSMDQNKGLMVDTLPLSSRNLGGQSWKQHQSSLERRDSAVAFPFDQPPSPVLEKVEPQLCEAANRSTSPSPVSTPSTEDGPSDVFYTADVLVPIELPCQKSAFIPTFHSCLVSRVYAIDMNLTVNAGAGNNPSLHLKIPVQITAPGSDKPALTDGMAPEGGYLGARQETRDIFAPNMASGVDSPPDFDDIPPLGGRRATYDLGALGRHSESVESDHLIDSEGEIDVRRPAWNVPNINAADTHAVAYQRESSSGERGDASPAGGASRAVSPFTRSSAARSPSPRTVQLTNDQILNTEEYEASDAEEQFGNFRWQPADYAHTGERANHGSSQSRRQSDILPPGYASVAAGTMLLGTGGLVRALS